jgi:phosphate:Na+ symporter
MNAIAPFIAGLGLFFCGVHFVSSNLVPLVGRRFRRLLMRLGRNVGLAAAFGVFAGAITQSTNAVTSIAIGLVSGGMIDKRRAILIPTWSHVGTSVLVILVAANFHLAASYLVAVAGAAIYFGFARDERIRHALGTVLGAGLLILGLQMLKSGADPLRDLLLDGDLWSTGAMSPAVLLLIGLAVSFACQSSSVAGALAVAVAGTGLVDLTGACWLVYGANLGSGANYALLARTHRGEAAQIALMQVAQKCAGFAIVMLAAAPELATGVGPVERLVSALSSTLAGQIAWLFLIYQIVGSLACTVLIERIVPLLERTAPPSDLQELSKPAYLIEEALVDPSFAIDLVGREERRLLARLPAMLDGIRADVRTVESPPPAILRQAGLSIVRAIARYLDQITEAKLDRRDRELVVRHQHRTANLGALFESLEEFTAACRAARQSPSGARVAEQMIESLHTLLSALVDAAVSEDDDDRTMLLALLGHRDTLMERIRQRVLREDPEMPTGAQEALFSATMLFERVVWLARRDALLLAPEPSGAEEPAGQAAVVEKAV